MSMVNNSTLADGSIVGSPDNAHTIPPAAGTEDKNKGIAQNVDVLAFGIDVLYKSAQVVSEQGQALFRKIKERGEAARSSAEYITILENESSDMVDTKTTKALPEGVKEYLRKNNILIEGKTIDDYLRPFNFVIETSGFPGNGGSPTKLLNKGQFLTIKTALQTFQDRASDFVSQEQLQVSKMSQNYQAVLLLINTLQANNFELLKSIFSKM